MWYGKYNNFTDDDWGDSISQKIKQITLKDLQNKLAAQTMKEELEYHFDSLLNNMEL